MMLEIFNFFYLYLFTLQYNPLTIESDLIELEIFNCVMWNPINTKSIEENIK